MHGNGHAQFEEFQKSRSRISEMDERELSDLIDTLAEEVDADKPATDLREYQQDKNKDLQTQRQQQLRFHEKLLQYFFDKIGIEYDQKHRGDLRKGQRTYDALGKVQARLERQLDESIEQFHQVAKTYVAAEVRFGAIAKQYELRQQRCDHIVASVETLEEQANGQLSTEMYVQRERAIQAKRELLQIKIEGGKAMQQYRSKRSQFEALEKQITTAQHFLSRIAESRYRLSGVLLQAQMNHDAVYGSDTTPSFVQVYEESAIIAQDLQHFASQQGYESESIELDEAFRIPTVSNQKDPLVDRWNRLTRS